MVDFSLCHLRVGYLFLSITQKFGVEETRKY